MKSDCYMLKVNIYRQCYILRNNKIDIQYHLVRYRHQELLTQSYYDFAIDVARDNANR